MYQDETLVCRDCNKEFIFSASEQAFYAEKGFQNKPRRCPECRAAFRAQNGNARPQREMFTAICADCGKETQVPSSRAVISPCTAAIASLRIVPRVIN